jgi:hypothetical protein
MNPIASARAFRKPAPLDPSHLYLNAPSDFTPPYATEHTGLLIKPLLPHNFYETPQYASFSPSNPLAEHPSMVLDSIGVAVTPCIIAPGTSKPDIRRPPSRQDQWRLNTEAAQIRCRLDNVHLRLEYYLQRNPHTIRHWADRRINGRHVASLKIAKVEHADAVETKKPRGRPKKIEVNRIKPYLQNFIFPKDALSTLPMFDDIITGAVVADAGGNTRPFSKSKMIKLLQSLDFISVEAIRQHEPQWSLRHAQKIAMCLRIIERHAFDIAEVHWPPPGNTDWTGID